MAARRLVGRVRRGVTSTAVAAAAMAALTASQGPGVELVQPGGRDAATSPDASDLPADGNSPYHTELPPLVKPDKPGSSNDLPGAAGPAESGIPATVLAAYKKAERTLGEERPGCNLPWQLLAAIGKVESGQARGGAVDAQGTTHKPILGPALNGVGFAHISDTDGGAYDGDTRYDRAVGPMQFIPSTWATWGADGNGDGREDPNNIYDAALAAGRYLCADGRNLSDPADLERAVLSYNHSREYLRTVLSWLEFYRKGVREVPDGEGALPESPGAGNESRPARPVTEPVTASTTRPKDGADGPKDKGGGKDEEDGRGDGTPSPRPPVSGGGTIRPLPPAESPEPVPPAPKPSDPEEPGEEPEEPEGPEEPEEPEEPAPTCPTDPGEPEDPEEPEEPGAPAPSETPAPSPSPTPTGDPEEPSDPEASTDPEEPGEEPEEDPCGDEDDQNGDEDDQNDGADEDGAEAEDGAGQEDGEDRTPAPSVGATVEGRLED